MLSHKKGQHYGEGHQKAPQISTDLLPLVDAIDGREHAAYLVAGLSAMLGIVFMRACAP
jgi:hypothetical protein